MKRAAAALLLALAASACTPQAYCAKRYECADDRPGDDFERICAIQYEGNIRALRANKEEECHRLADAIVALNACESQLDCDDFQEQDRGGKCDDEIDDFNDAFEDAEDECGSRD